MSNISRRRAELIANTVLETILSSYGLSRPGDIYPWLELAGTSPKFELRNPESLAGAAAALRSPAGRFRFHVDLASAQPGSTHPMVAALQDAAIALSLGEPIEHPLETDPRDGGQRYKSVMSVRVVPSAGIALSSEAMPFHQDGLGSAGSIRFVAMCLDSGPSAGGRQLYSNALAQGLVLADRHWDRFVAATQLDALTVTRLAGKQHVSITGPMFYVDECGIPAAFFRGQGGEYAIMPSASVSPWFEDHCQAVSAAAHVEVLAPGDCLVVDNLSMVHARDSFEEDPAALRRLSRKWYAIQPSRVGVWTREPFRLNASIYGDATLR